MELYNRRLLLLNEDVPISTISSLPLLQDNEPATTTTNSSSPPESMPSSPPPPPPPPSPSSSTFGRPLQLPPRPFFTSEVAYAFLVLFTAFFFLGFILLYIRQFAGNSATTASSRRRRRYHGHHPHSSCGGVDPTTVQSLPVFTYHGDVKQKQKQQQMELDCAICLEELQEGDTVKMIPYCKHVFHPQCVDTWLIAHVTCPICRCTKFCEVEEGGGRIDEHGGGSTVQNGGQGREVGSPSHSPSERTRTRTRTRSSSGSNLGFEDTVTVALRRTLSY